MHCANYDGGVFPNLKQAFAEAPAQVPRTIFKVDGTSAQAFGAKIRSVLSQTGLERMDIAQVCGFPVSEEPEAVLATMAEAHGQGLADHFIMDMIHPWCGKALTYLSNDLFEGYIFYYNVVECHVDPEFLDLAIRNDVPLFAMRTFGRGALLDPVLRRPYLQSIFDNSGMTSWIDFAVHGALSLPGAVTTLAGSGNIEHLDELIGSAGSFQPLDPALVTELLSCHHQWNRDHGVR